VFLQERRCERFGGDPAAGHELLSALAMPPYSSCPAKSGKQERWRGMQRPRVRRRRHYM
jgi:hypothetical protein